MSLDQTHYDVAIFSTGLTQSILSAALASAGLSVIHIDKNDYYADQWASLTLSELAKWSESLKHHDSLGGSQQNKQRLSHVELCFPAFNSTSDEQNQGESCRLPESLASLDRHYAISLAPTLLPATGPSIDCLISSKVSSYATFRLLERTCVASASTQNAGRMALTSVPASKEDIFKTKTLSLIAKRKLMKLLMYIATQDWQSNLAEHPDLARKPFVEYLAEVHNMPPDLVDAVAYGVCLCATPRETTEVAMARAKSHMQSVGRYGNSAYLVGQYGGAGELAQGYCRASAVKGGTFILAHRIRSAKKHDKRPNWELEVDGIDTPITADYIVSSQETLQDLGLYSVDQSQTPASEAETIVLHRAILVLDRPIQFAAPTSIEASTNDSSNGDATADTHKAPEHPPETGLVVFPPGSVGGNANAVTILMMGEGTFSCPKGQYVYYMLTEASDADTERSALETLQPVIDQVIALTSESGSPTDLVLPLLQMTYRQLVPSLIADEAHSNLANIPFPPPLAAQDCCNSQPVTSISGLADAAVHLAEKVYYDIIASRVSSSNHGNTHEEKVEWIKQTVEQQKRDRKRRNGRDPSEFQGRGGRGADDGVTKEQQQEEQDEPRKDEAVLVGFFESSSDTNDDDDDEADP
ncbi:related to Rab proteins geranylgeranyltransferase component A 2 [Ustilago trichophora]|uniref:Related to Rab proteins geranylgeranyltransferase component A 2 n=1 Tax=Ustilago trichophora TaxID=86804 RepID=A0A5C3EEM4_9BASI|nr:related to Rab proteins geranylgeranyltransferase component A 2 [Ustilago trichophora]